LRSSQEHYEVPAFLINFGGQVCYDFLGFDAFPSSGDVIIADGMNYGFVLSRLKVFGLSGSTKQPVVASEETGRRSQD